MQDHLVVGVDVGGTKVAAGLVDCSGKIHAQSRMPMVASDAALGLAAVAAVIDELQRMSPGRDRIRPIGICAPGPLNPTTGMIINPPNLPGWHKYPLADEIRRLYPGAKVKIDNDANAAALAEAKWGAGRGYPNVFYATIGTGIGTGIVFDGRIYHGRTGAAAEGGHVSVDYRGAKCRCGKRGCIEVFASGPAIARRARTKLAEGLNRRSAVLELANGDIEAVTSETIGQAYEAGDPLAKEVLEETI